MSPQNNTQSEFSFDIVTMIKLILKRKNTLIRYLMAFVSLGLLIAILSPNEYIASSTFIPRINDEQGSGRQLGGLAALAGIGGLAGESSSGEIPPEIYPRIIASSNYKSQLANSLVETSDMDSAMTFMEYMENHYEEPFFNKIKKYTIGLPGLLIKTIKGKGNLTEKVIENKHDDIIELSKQQIAIFEIIGSRLTVGYMEKEGIVSIRYQDYDPDIASQMTNSAKEILQLEIRNYKLQIANQNLDFIQRRFEEKAKDFEQVQINLARFRDKNQGISSALARNELERLETDFDLKYNLYLDVAKQLEQAKLVREKDTPVFTVIQPVIKPYKRSFPNRVLILIGFSFLGIVLGLVHIFAQNMKVLIQTQNDGKSEI